MVVVGVEEKEEEGRGGGGGVVVVVVVVVVAVVWSVLLLLLPVFAWDAAGKGSRRGGVRLSELSSCRGVGLAVGMGRTRKGTPLYFSPPLRLGGVCVCV